MITTTILGYLLTAWLWYKHTTNVKSGKTKHMNPFEDMPTLITMSLVLLTMCMSITTISLMIIYLP